MDRIQQKIVNILSMAACANKVISGDFAIDKAVGSKLVRLILIAENTAEKTRADYEKIALANEIPVMVLGISKQVLGNCIGKNERAAAAVCDEGFAGAINKILK